MGTPKKQDPSKIRYLTIHCAATPEGRNVSTDAISKWDIEKFGQISYHWVVELDGKATRTLDDNQIGAHVGKANTGNIGICYIGGMDAQMKKAKDTRTPSQKLSLARLIREYQAKYPGIIVRGHRDWPGVKKDCPSFEVKGFVKEISEGKFEVEQKKPEPVQPDFSSVTGGSSGYNPHTKTKF